MDLIISTVAAGTGILDKPKLDEHEVTASDATLVDKEEKGEDTHHVHSRIPCII